MNSLDFHAPNFRRAQLRWPDAPTLAACYDGLGECLESSGHGVVEHVKSFIECVCVTILAEHRAGVMSGTPTTTELLVAALKPLGLQNARGASKLDKVLSGFNKLADALSEMRNENGAVAHGRDAFIDSLSAEHSRIFLHAGDAILGILMNAIEGKEPNLAVTREPYDRFPHLNRQIDHAVGIAVRIEEAEGRPMVVFSVSTGPNAEAFEIRAVPSQLLYGIDRSAYVEVLRSVAAAGADEWEDETADAPLRLPESLGDTSDSDNVKARVANVPAYSGRLDVIRSGLGAFLGTQAATANAPAADGATLVDSLLATAELSMGVDWREREALQAAMKVGSRRAFVRFGLGLADAEKAAERLLKWYRENLPDSIVSESAL